MNELENYLTAKQISQEFGVTPDHVRLTARRRKVKSMRPGNEYLILRADWEQYEQNKKPWGAKRGARKTKKTGKRKNPTLVMSNVESPRHAHAKNVTQE